MANPIAIALKQDLDHKYTDIVDVSGIGSADNILPPGAQIGDQVYFDQFDSKGGEVFIDGGGNVTALGEFNYFYYTDSAETWGPIQLFGALPAISYNLQGSFRPDVTLEGTFRPDITLIGRLNP